VTAPATGAPTAAGAARPGQRPAGAARAQRLAAAVVAGALVAGAALGVAADRVWLGRQRVEPLGRLDAFAADLALTPAQRAAVDTILDERQRVMDSLVAPVRPQLDAARAAARRQIRARLTGSQQARFDEYVARTERRARERGR
jgi:Spy/CpxP family protein refolding chaperone